MVAPPLGTTRWIVNETDVVPAGGVKVKPAV